MAERSDYVPSSRVGEADRARSPRGVLSQLILARALRAFAAIVLVQDHIIGGGGARPLRPSGALERVVRAGVCSPRCPGASQSLDR